MIDIILNLNGSRPPRTWRETLAPWAAEARQILILGLPLAATQLAQIAIMTTDVIMLGALGPASLAAASIGVHFYFIGWLIAFGPIAAVSPIIAQKLGADPTNTRDVRRAVRMAFWVAVLVVVPIWGVYAASPWIFRGLGQPEELIEVASHYVWALAPGLLFALGFNVIRNFGSALSRTRAAFFASFAMIGVNVLLNYAFIYGNWGAPRLEVTGAGIASTGSNLFGFLVLLVWALKGRGLARFEILSGFWRPDWPMFRELFRLGAPIGLTLMFEAMLFNAAIFLMGRIGTIELAAHQIALNVASITFMVPLGFAMAGTVRVGLAAGAGDPERVRIAAWSTIAAGSLWMVLCALVIVLFPRTIAGLYFDEADPANAALMAYAVTFLWYAAAFQVFDAAQVTAAHALRGIKDTRLPMFIAGFSYWVIGMPICVWLAFYSPLRGEGIWIGFLVALGFAAFLMVGRVWLMTRLRRDAGIPEGILPAEAG